MHILGIANGTSNGNSEILLKAALLAAKEASPTVTVSWAHAPSVSIPLGAPLLESKHSSVGASTVGKPDPSLHGDKTVSPAAVPDDRPALLDAILDADALIFSTPVYSHQPAGALKAVLDRITGPFTDASFAQRVQERKAAGDPDFQHLNIDERLLKPRVAAFICCAGSSTPDQVTMALPTLHLQVYCFHAKVVDQFVAMSVGGPGIVVAKEGGVYVERARQLGRNVASQLGVPFDNAKYMGEEPRGACPNCHLSKIDFYCTSDNAIECVVCGTQGKLVQATDGVLEPRWDTKCDISSITMAGKLRHVDDLFANGAIERQIAGADLDFDKKKAYWAGVELPKVALPSQKL